MHRVAWFLTAAVVVTVAIPATAVAAVLYAVGTALLVVGRAMFVAVAGAMTWCDQQKGGGGA